MKRLSMVGAVLAIVGAMQSSAAAAPVQIDFNVAGFGPTPGTTSSFTKEGVAFAAAMDSKIVLIGGEELVALMIDHNIGVTPVASYEIKRVDTDYFTGE